jgi:hypothetical protein
MRTHPKLDSHQMSQVDEYRKHGFPLSVERSQIRMAPGGILLHKDKVTEDLDVRMFVGEAFRKFVLAAFLPKNRVPSGVDYNEARWDHCGYDFYSHGSVVSPLNLGYTISLLGPHHCHQFVPRLHE